MNFWEKNEQGASGQPTGAENNRSGSEKGEQSGNGVPNGMPNPQIVEEQLRKYSGMNEQQLLTELMRSANGMKAEGRLSAAELESFYSRAAMFMSTEQLAKLRTIINMLN